jgi:hypothetical protein
MNIIGSDKKRCQLGRKLHISRLHVRQSLSLGTQIYNFERLISIIDNAHEKV